MTTYNFDTHFRMNEEAAIQYAQEKLTIFPTNAQLTCQEIGDGNINYVFRVQDTTGGTSVIIKHADVLLRSSGRELDVHRNEIEANILQLHGTLAPGLVPKVYAYDPVMCIVAMEDVGRYKNLRSELLARKTFPTLAEEISTFMVRTLLPTTDIAMDSATKKDAVSRYINKDLCKISEDLVFTEPYIDYKGRNIITDGNLEYVQRELYEDDSLLLEAAKLKQNFMNNAQALLHGDLHSGSIFANQTGIKVLDPEFAFYGPIGYDVGNVIGNLIFAWINCHFTEENLSTRDSFIEWISTTIADTIDHFRGKFRALYPSVATDVLTKRSAYMEWYLQSVMADTAAAAGMEIIRRTVGDAKVADITSITDHTTRLTAERVLIQIGKRLILMRQETTTGRDYLTVVTETLS